MSVFWLLFLFVWLLVTEHSWMRCIHDDIASPDLITRTVDYIDDGPDTETDLSRKKRNLEVSNQTLAMEISNQTLAVKVSNETMGLEVSNETMGVEVSNETMGVEVSNETMGVEVSNETMGVEVSNETMGVEVSNETMGVEVSNETMGVEVSNETMGVEVSNETQALEEEHQPLRIHVHHVNSVSLSEDKQDLVRKAVEQAVQKIYSVLSVIPVVGPLLLPRSEACGFVLKGGLKKGKCTRLAKGYRGEECLDMFRIPSEHLEGFSLHNNPSHLKPIREVFRAGPGVNNTDVILYVVASSTKQCRLKDRSVLAFASYCRVDKTGRPVAGLINFCPFTLMRTTVTQHFLYMTALHEILHVLGFSTKLFDTFRRCTDGVCKKGKADLRLVQGQYRLVSPTVVNLTKQHFGCHHSSPDYGGPLLTKNDKATSHWESRMMHTSLMTAEGDNTSYQVLDPITLAVFEDSGWYRVNFSNADTFLWGKDAGCLFAAPDHCLESKEYFCSDNSSGCHFLWGDKGICDAYKTGNQCGIYAPIPQGSCTQNFTQEKLKHGSLEIFSASSRCFLSSVKPASSQNGGEGFIGQCYSRKCSENGTVFVKLQGTEWLPCPPGQAVQISGLEGNIQCPNNTDTLCWENTQQPVSQTQRPTSQTSTQHQGTSNSAAKSTAELTTVLYHTTHTIRSSAGKITGVLHIEYGFVTYLYISFFFAYKYLVCFEFNKL